ncbi:DNA-binding protein [Acetobacteraceae bacterium KSS8]|uniref:DNA-binding protein n=1 Tax=Endosaccharibacter trunci TaxID=2812733 RepID=A0ABT1WAL8_9PROT|nr:DNA-binding protein [Acetobacteraceae bacterium KSS8]
MPKTVAVQAFASEVPPPEPKATHLSKIDALPLGLAPRYFSARQAAAYLGVGIDTFRREVERGWWPKPLRRGGAQGLATWDRRLLDIHADRLSGLEATTCAEPPAIVEPAVNLVARMDRTRSDGLRTDRRRRSEHGGGQ